jgi:hypothetical protein
MEREPIDPREVGGRTWARGAGGKIEELVASDHIPPTALRFFYLPGFVEYCRSNPDGLVMDECLVVVCNHGRVELLTPPNPANCNKRFCYAVADYQGGRFGFDRWQDQEDFMVGLQTRFVETDNLKKLRRLVGKLADITEAQVADNGLAQVVNVKTGVTTVDQVEIQNPIALTPWATFADVPQPEGLFNLRLKKGNGGPRCCLFEADTDSWRVRAVGLIRDYLRQELPDGLVVLA